jgi:HK97 family phage major capsid protein
MVIDLLRAKSIMSAAGAQTIPLTTEETRIALVETDPVAYWTSEGDLIVESEGTFGSVNMYSKALAVYSEVSLELLRNAANAEQVISDTIIGALTCGLDSACLSGNGVIKPLGLLNATDQVTASAFGGPFTYDGLLTRMGTLWGVNCESNTLLLPPALRTYIAKLKDGEGLPLTVPPEVAKLRQFTSSQITSNDAYPVAYVGDFSNCLIGIRSGIEIEVSGTSGTVFQRKKVAIRGLIFADFNAGPVNRVIKMTGFTGT